MSNTVHNISYTYDIYIFTTIDSSKGKASITHSNAGLSSLTLRTDYKVTLPNEIFAFKAGTTTDDVQTE